jgi:hypothetical protein
VKCALAILSSVASPALLYISTLSHKRQDFRKKKLPKIIRVFRFSLQLLSDAFLILLRLLRLERDMTKNVQPIGLPAKRPLLVSDFNET